VQFALQMNKRHSQAEDPLFSLEGSAQVAYTENALEITEEFLMASHADALLIEDECLGRDRSVMKAHKSLTKLKRKYAKKHVIEVLDLHGSAGQTKNHLKSKRTSHGQASQRESHGILTIQEHLADDNASLCMRIQSVHDLYRLSRKEASETDSNEAQDDVFTTLSPLINYFMLGSPSLTVDQRNACHLLVQIFATLCPEPYIRLLGDIYDHYSSVLKAEKRSMTKHELVHMLIGKVTRENKWPVVVEAEFDKLGGLCKGYNVRCVQTELGPYKSVKTKQLTAKGQRQYIETEFL
jgi:hypothetical protein